MAGTAPATTDPPWDIDTALHQQVLGAVAFDDIPYFTELTALYVGSFLAAVMTLALMSFREYAKEALGLSERDLVLGRALGEPNDSNPDGFA